MWDEVKSSVKSSLDRWEESRSAIKSLMDNWLATQQNVRQLRSAWQIAKDNTERLDASLKNGERVLKANPQAATPAIRSELDELKESVGEVLEEINSLGPLLSKMDDALTGVTEEYQDL